ncbi:MAG TPA: sigma-70 family RNA polymerase sigma factor [Polyangia bacterium]|nr:sigma-70 family RNA polymerase sigma factor [Polyangia bacterium]
MSLMAAATQSSSEIPQKEGDRRLVIALLAGTPDAPGQAWKTFAPMVLRILQRTLGPGPDQQDLSQEVFFRLFARMRELRDHGALRTFLVNITLGVAQNERRRRRNRRLLGLTHSGDLPEHPVAGADFEARQTISRCHRILDCLGADDRVLFVRRHVEKMEIAEIVAVTGWSRSTTKRRLARVTARVVRLMEHDPVLAEYAPRFGYRAGALS